MKSRCLYLFIATFCLAHSSCVSVNKFYIVRHAEKEGGNNPHLTADGDKRARVLCDTLRNKNIGFIFTTDSNRTIETARPTATLLGLTISRYANDTLPQFVQRLKGITRNTLVVGHTSTVLRMLDALGLTHTLATITEGDFDNLYIVSRTKYYDGSVRYSITESHYGAFTPP